MKLDCGEKKFVNGGSLVVTNNLLILGKDQSLSKQSEEKLD
jgi:hypothetical protein